MPIHNINFLVEVSGQSKRVILQFLCVLIEDFSLLISDLAVKFCLYDICLRIFAMKMIKGISGQVMRHIPIKFSILRSEATFHYKYFSCPVFCYWRFHQASFPDLRRFHFRFHLLLFLNQSISCCKEIISVLIAESVLRLQMFICLLTNFQLSKQSTCKTFCIFAYCYIYTE